MRPENEAGRAIIWEFTEAYPFKISLAGERPNMRMRARDAKEQSMHVWALGASEHTDGAEHPVLLLEEHSGYSASGATIFLRELSAEQWSSGRGPFEFSRQRIPTSIGDLLNWLEGVGAEIERPRHVITLYQIVRMARFAGRKRLISTLLAYPIFIAESPSALGQDKTLSAGSASCI